MSASTVGFLGGGRIVRILLEGWERAGSMPVEVIVVDNNPEVLARLQARFPAIRTASDTLPLRQVACVFIALHPPAVLDALRPLAGGLRSDALVVSLAPKVRIDQLSESLAGYQRIARSIPNAASLVNAGFNPVAFGADLSAAAREAVLALFQPLGDCPVVPEAHLESYAVLTAMGPTYLWFQLQQLRELGKEFGLPSADVDAGLNAMAIGAARTLFESGLGVAEVLDLVPVKPLVEQEATICSMYREKLTAIQTRLSAR